MDNRLSFIDNDIETRYSPNNVNQHIRRHVGWAGESRRCSGEAHDTRAGVSCQYTSVSAATAPPDGGWQYDARGNLRSDGSRRFRWDGKDRLTRAVVPNAAEGKQRVDYRYDGKSCRVIRKQGREHTLYVYDRWNCIAEYTLDGRNADSVLTTRYVWGTDLSNSLQHRDLGGADGDEVEARRVRHAMNRMSNQRAGGVGGLLHADEVTNGRGKTKGYYLHYDGNGNVTAVTNAKGRRAASYTYDAFGNILESNGGYAEQNSYHLSTKPQDEVPGFYYYGYRYYDPATGRWPSRDPIGERGGINLFGMVGNSAVNWLDYLRLEKQAGCKTTVHVGHGSGLIPGYDELQFPQPQRHVYVGCSANYLNSGVISAGCGVPGTTPNDNSDVISDEEYEDCRERTGADVERDDFLGARDYAARMDEALEKAKEQAKGEDCKGCCKVEITVDCKDADALHFDQPELRRAAGLDTPSICGRTFTVNCPDE